MCHSIVRVLGRSPYFVSMSSSELARGEVGTRQIRDAKDASKHFGTRSDPVDEHHCVVLIDVDFHMTRGEIAHYAALGVPIVMYTFNPSSPSFMSDEINAQYSGDSFKFRGPAFEATHELWDWSCDIVALPDFSIRGFTLTFCKVRTRDLGSSRAVVLLTPLSRKTGVSALIEWWCCAHPTLERYQPEARPGLDGKTIIYGSTAFGDNGPELRLSCEGSGVTSTYPSRVVAIANALNTANRKLTQGNLSTSVAQARIDGLFLTADEYDLLAVWASNGACSVSTLGTAWRPCSLTYVVPNPKAQSVRKPVAVRTVMAAIVPGERIALLHSAETKEDSAIRRVLAPAANTADRPMDSWLLSIMGEFVEHMAVARNINGDETHRGRLHLHTFETASASCQRPTQRVVNDQGEFELNAPLLVKGLTKRPTLRGFLKREAITKFKDSRLITPVDAVTRSAAMRIAHTLSTHCKKLHWYVFGRKPRDWAQLLASKAFGSLHAHETDAGRMDATINALCRLLHLLLVRRLFMVRDLDFIEATLERCRGRSVSLGDGVRYETQEQQLSGDPFTSVFNTIIAAFAEYLAWRHSGTGSKQAWMNLGLHGGDDGIDFDLPEGANTWAYKRMGLTLKEKRVERLQPFVFLSRMFGPNAWLSADPSNGADPERVLSQIHITCAAALTDTEAIVAKGISYSFTDRYSHVIGAVAIRMASCSPEALRTVMKKAATNRDVLSFHALQTQKRGGSFQSADDDMQWYEQHVNTLFHVDKINALLEWCDERGPISDPPSLRAPVCKEIIHPEILMIGLDGDERHVRGGPSGPLMPDLTPPKMNAKELLATVVAEGPADAIRKSARPARGPMKTRRPKWKPRGRARGESKPRA